MSQDVEIIDVEEIIIEISDEEDSNAVLTIDDDVQEIVKDITANEVSQDAERMQHLNATSSENCVPSESRAAMPVPVNVRESEIKKEINIINDSQHIVNLATPVNNFVSHVVKSENKKRNKRKRKRKKNAGSKKTVGAVSKEMVSNSFDNDKHSNCELANFVQPIQSSSTKNLSPAYDFSKLKWLKPLSNFSSPPHLQLVIIDRSHPFWRIENEKWMMVEKRLLEALNAEMIKTNDTSIGLFDGAKWQRGIKIVGCHNENTFNFVMNFCNKLDKLWNGARLEAFPMTKINPHIVKAYIPPPIIKTEVIMSLIKLQNPTEYGSDWKVIRERERPNGGGLDIWISMNEQSFMHLSNVKMEIKFGINRIFLNPSS